MAAKVYYHAILGRANALFRMFEAANIHAELEGDMSKVLASRGAAVKNFAPPVVEIDGVFVSQSQACVAFVGAKCGFDKGLDSCVAMQYMLDLTDMASEAGSAMGKGADAFKAFWAEGGRGDKFLTMIEAQIQGPFYTGDGMHYCDFFLHQAWESLLLICLGKCPAILDAIKAKFPKIIGVYNGIKSLTFTRANDPVMPPAVCATDEWAATIN